MKKRDNYFVKSASVFLFSTINLIAVFSSLEAVSISSFFSKISIKNSGSTFVVLSGSEILFNFNRYIPLCNGCDNV